MTRFLRSILPNILAAVTGKQRERVDIKWSSKSWIHNIFRVWELIFWRKIGIRAELTMQVVGGYTRYDFRSWEAVCAHIEWRIRNYKLPFKVVKVYLPQFAYAGIGHLPRRTSPYLFAIAFDAAVSGGTTSLAALTYSHTVTGSNPVLFVGANDGNESIISQTYALASMTAVAAAVSRNAGSNDFGTVNLFYLLAPATGANNVVITKSGAVSTLGAWSSSYTGGQQSGALDVVDRTDDSTPGTTLTQNITTTVDNDWAVLFNANSADAITSTSNWSTRFISGAVGATAYGDTNGALTPAGAKSFGTTRTGSIGHIGGFAAAFTVFVAPSGPANMKSYDGNVKANIKSMFGNVLANVKSFDGNS